MGQNQKTFGLSMVAKGSLGSLSSLAFAPSEVEECFDEWILHVGPPFLQTGFPPGRS